MIRLDFTPAFFASVLCTEPEKLRFGLLVRRWHDGHEPLYRAALAVDGVVRHAFDIEEGQFVPLGERTESRVVFLPVEPTVTDEAVCFETVGYRYPLRAFRARYAARVVHPSLA